MDKRFEEVEHTADLALRVWGEDLAALFISAARGMAWLMADPEGIEVEVEFTVELSAGDVETLLVTWLGELLYLSERENLVFTEFDLEQVSSTHLVGKVRGGAPERWRNHIKAATFSELDIREMESGLGTNVVFDV